MENLLNSSKENNAEFYRQQYEALNMQENKTLDESVNVFIRSCQRKSNCPKKIRKQSKLQEMPDPKIILNCDICNTKFNSEIKFKKHKKNHEYEKPYQCDQCSESFNVLENLTLHISVHNMEQFRCPQCGKIFNRLASLQGHIKTHFKNEFFTCSHCGDMFYVLAKYKQHLCTVHPSNKYQLQADREEKAAKRRIEKGRKKICRICGKVFSKNFLLQRHERIHKNVKPYKCDECKRSFTQKYSLVIHQLKHSGERPHQCLLCPQRFSQKGNLLSHVSRCHSNQFDQLFSCNFCPCTFRKRRSLNHHITRYHITTTNDAGIDDVMRQLNEIQRPDPLENQHEQMQKINRKETNFMTNPKSRVNVATEKYEETIATDISTNPSKEVSVVQLNDFLASGASVHNVIQHRTEGRPRTLICTFCEKSFKRPSDMLRHIRIHTKEKPFECDICNRKFNVKGTLQTHMRLHDKNIPIFPCDWCKKTFRSSKSLKAHCRMRHPRVDRCESIIQNTDNFVNINSESNSFLDMSKSEQNTELDVNSKQNSKPILRCDLCKK